MTSARVVSVLCAFAGISVLLVSQGVMYTTFKTLLTANEGMNSCVRFMTPPAVFMGFIALCVGVILCRILVANLFHLKEKNDVGIIIYVLGYVVVGIVFSLLVMIYRFEPDHPFNELTNMYEGHKDYVDRIQTDMKCCGANSYLDWKNNITNGTFSEKQWWFDIPASCRRQEPISKDGRVFYLLPESLETLLRDESEDSQIYYLFPGTRETLLRDEPVTGQICSPFIESLENSFIDEPEDGQILFLLPESLETFFKDKSKDGQIFYLFAESLETLLRDQPELDPEAIFYTEGCSPKCRIYVCFIGFWILRVAVILIANVLLCPCLFKLMETDSHICDPVNDTVETQPDEIKKEQEAVSPGISSLYEV